MLLNYEYQWVRKGKYIFAPNDDCDRRAKQLIRFIERSVELPLCFYHYRKGGHVAALHQHLENQYFFKIDIRNFFYSISRNRIASVLHRIGYPYARTSRNGHRSETRIRRDRDSCCRSASVSLRSWQASALCARP